MEGRGQRCVRLALEKKYSEEEKAHSDNEDGSDSYNNLLKEIKEAKALLQKDKAEGENFMLDYLDKENTLEVSTTDQVI